MQIIDLFAAELGRESARSRRVLENVPDGRSDRKPHEKSMQFGYLANMVATMPMWIAMMLQQDELDIAPVGGSRQRPNLTTSAEYVAALDAVGRDITGVERLINHRLGVRRRDDTLPDRWFEEPIAVGAYKGEKIDRGEFDRLLTRFFPASLERAS